MPSLSIEGALGLTALAPFLFPSLHALAPATKPAPENLRQRADLGPPSAPSVNPHGPLILPSWSLIGSCSQELTPVG